MKGNPVEYKYNTSLNWTSEKKGILQSSGKPDIKVACPPEFGGHPDIWSPEDLFIGAAEICTLTTFLWFINKEKIKLKSYNSNTSGTVKMMSGVFRFSSITVDLKISLLNKEDIKRVETIMKKVKKACLISNSMNTEINVYYEINSK